MTDFRAAIAAGKTSLGIEFGSTRVKAVLIGEDAAVLAEGSHTWENRFENGCWTYRESDMRTALQSCYAALKANVKETYGLVLTTVGALGVSDEVGISIYADNYVYNGAPRRIFLGTAYTNQSISAGASMTVNFSWNKTGTVIIDDVKHTLTNMNTDGIEIRYVVDKAEDKAEYVAYNECREDDNETASSTKLVECDNIIY